MNRRDFLKRSALLTAGTLIGSSAISSLLSLQSCSQALASKNFGLQLYSLRDGIAKDLDSTFKFIADVGCKSIESAGYKENGKIFGYEPLDIKKAAENYGMNISSSHVGRQYRVGKEAETLEWWKKCFDVQNELGVKYVIQSYLPLGNSLDEVKICSDYFNTLADIAHSKGLQFGFHNHAKEFEKRDGVVIFDYFLQNANPNMAFQLDVYWAMKGGVDPTEFILKHGDKIPLLHIKDEDIVGASGTLNFESIFNAAYKMNVQDFFVEIESSPLVSPEECVSKSFEFLNNASYVR
ncbi:MAG: TIM barrel protein [Rikenellaceae bacterium]